MAPGKGKAEEMTGPGDHGPLERIAEACNSQLVIVFSEIETLGKSIPHGDPRRESLLNIRGAAFRLAGHAESALKLMKQTEVE